jgi:hypothetical protein
LRDRKDLFGVTNLNLTGITRDSKRNSLGILKKAKRIEDWALRIKEGGGVAPSPLLSLFTPRLFERGHPGLGPDYCAA